MPQKPRQVAAGHAQIDSTLCVQLSLTSQMINSYRAARFSGGTL